jgi:cytochrome P450
MLLKTSIKKNLYYEIKERRDEEVINGINIKRPARRVKVYGSTSGKKKRDDLISILHQRVQHHRDKFMTREIYDELCTMVVKPNGKVEHADDAHDDLVFS